MTKNKNSRSGWSNEEIGIKTKIDYLYKEVHVEADFLDALQTYDSFEDDLIEMIDNKYCIPNEESDLYLELMNSLSEREQKIMELRLNGWSFQKIGDELNLSKQRIHKIYNLSVQKLKSKLGEEK